MTTKKPSNEAVYKALQFASKILYWDGAVMMIALWEACYGHAPEAMRRAITAGVKFDCLHVDVYGVVRFNNPHKPRKLTMPPHRLATMLKRLDDDNCGIIKPRRHREASQSRPSPASPPLPAPFKPSKPGDCSTME